MENNNNKLLSDFFNSNKSGIQDNGFSDRVLSQLPQKRRRKTGWIVPVFTLFGVLLSLVLIDLEKVFAEIYNFVLQIPLLYYIGIIITIPIMFLALFFYAEKQNRLQ